MGANADAVRDKCGKFASLSEREQKMIQALAMYCAAHTTGTAPTNAAWNTDIQAAAQAMTAPAPESLQHIWTGLWWDYTVSNVASGIAVAGRTASQLMGYATYLQGLDDPALDKLIAYLQFKAFTIFT